jgi:hypothetical protein
MQLQTPVRVRPAQPLLNVQERQAKKQSWQHDRQPVFSRQG